MACTFAARRGASNVRHRVVNDELVSKTFLRMQPVELHEPRTRDGHEVGLKLFDSLARRGSLLPDDHGAFPLELLL